MCAEADGTGGVVRMRERYIGTREEAEAALRDYRATYCDTCGAKMATWKDGGQEE